MNCACGVEVDRRVLAEAIGNQIDEGEIIESIKCSYCPSCSDLDGDGYIFQIIIE